MIVMHGNAKFVFLVVAFIKKYFIFFVLIDILLLSLVVFMYHHYCYEVNVELCF